MRKLIIVTISLSALLCLCLGITVLTMNEIASEGKMWFQSEGETDAYDFPILDIPHFYEPS